jgi:hypothetical protein
MLILAFLATACFVGAAFTSSVLTKLKKRRTDRRS